MTYAAPVPRLVEKLSRVSRCVYVVYEGGIPATQPRAITKLARKTHYIERFNNTLRQRVSRLGREALSFSKKLAYHMGAIKLFICHDNLIRAAA